MTIRIGVAGCGGRTGQILVEAVLAADGAELAGASARPGANQVGGDVGRLIGGQPLGLAVLGDARALFACSDVVLDFTTPDATMAHAELAAETGKALVVGTTGLMPDQEKRLGQLAADATIVYAPNFSVGVNLLLSVVETVARTLDPTYDVEIVEMHHRHKVDAPSGTALGLGQAAARGRGVALEDVWCKARDGHTGARPVGEIGFATLRGGDVAGDHSVIFAADGERIEISHKASHRTLFAKGAVRAGLWAARRAPGLYSMREVLDL